MVKRRQQVTPHNTAQMIAVLITLLDRSSSNAYNVLKTVAFYFGYRVVRDA